MIDDDNPEVIWLDPICAYDNIDGRFWHVTPPDRCDECDLDPVEYRRADLLTTPAEASVAEVEADDILIGLGRMTDAMGVDDPRMLAQSAMWRIHGLTAERDALRAEVERLRTVIERLQDALTPFSRAGALFSGAPGDAEFDQCIYKPAAGNEYSICGDDLRRARAALKGASHDAAGDIRSLILPDDIAPLLADRDAQIMAEARAQGMREAGHICAMAEQETKLGNAMEAMIFHLGFTEGRKVCERSILSRAAEIDEGANG